MFNDWNPSFFGDASQAALEERSQALVSLKHRSVALAILAFASFQASKALSLRRDFNEIVF